MSVTNCDQLLIDVPRVSQITEALLQQCKKQTLPYKAIAIETTGEAVEVLEVDIFQELSEILLPLVDVSSLVATPSPVF